MNWKKLIELVLALAFSFVGAGMAINGIQGEPLFGVLPPWVGIIAGVLVLWINLDRVADRWNEL